MNKNILIVLLVLVIAGLSATLFFSSGQQAGNPPIAEQPTVPPDNENGQCGIENCHGLDIKCGPNPAQICTEIYQLGDKCRQYAKCEISNGKCGLAENPKFTACKACVDACEKNNNDPMSAFDCESGCE